MQPMPVTTPMPASNNITTIFHPAITYSRFSTTNIETTIRITLRDRDRITAEMFVPSWMLPDLIKAFKAEQASVKQKTRQHLTVDGSAQIDQ